MKNPRNHARPHVGLMLPLAAFIGTVLSLVFITSASSLGSTSPARAQDTLATLGRWTTGGPDGGQVAALAIDRSNPVNVYAGTPNGVFKSADAGATWTSSLTNTSVQFVVIPASTPTTIYAGGNDGVHKSIDSGATWSAINQGLENQNGPIYILALTVDSANPDIVYAAGPDIADPTGAYKAIYKTTDGGANWNITKSSIRFFAVHHALAIDPLNRNIIYAAGSVGNGTVWKSTDNGGFWTIVNVGPDSQSTVYALAIDPGHTNILYAGTTARGVYKSVDSGATWNVFADGLPSYVIDGGQRNFQGVTSLVIDPADSNVIYAGTFGGVFKSSNGGTWTALNGDLVNLSVNGLAIGSADSTIYVATYGGVFKTLNGGTTWNADSVGLGGASANSIAVNPGNGNIYAWTSAGTFKSINNGGSWTQTNFFPLAFDAHDPATIYARVDGTDGLFKSNNAGATWSSVAAGAANAYASFVVIDPNNSNVIYASTDAFYKSTDGGLSWNRTANNLYFYAYLLVIDPSNSQTLYAAFDDGNIAAIYKSIDGGASWQISSGAESTFLYYVSSLAIDPKNPATLYASACATGAPACGIYRSTDHGASWIRSTDVPEGDVSSLVVDPEKANVIYVGTYGDGVFKSSDGGGGWNAFNDGLISHQINALAIDASGNFLHAGTTAGVFDVQLSAPRPNTVQFSSSSYEVDEGAARVEITLTRTGETIGPATVSFATNDSAGLDPCSQTNQIASPRCDYINTIGSISFAAGESGSKSFSVAIVDDSYAEGNESFTVSLTQASGTSIDPQSTATVTIHDNEDSNGTNPIDNTRFFVRQQYVDFLGREPDEPNFTLWANGIDSCAVNVTECDRIHVSQFFYQSNEFQSRGYYIFKFYPASFPGVSGVDPPGAGHKPDYAQFSKDLATVSGFLTEAQLNVAKDQFAVNFVARPAFVARYEKLGNTDYVDLLLSTAGVSSTLPATVRQSLINGLNAGTLTRAQALRQIVDSVEISARYFNEGFVVMQYFGYLRRDPDALYLEWIKLLDANSSDSRHMIEGFVNSTEYRQRFGL